MVQIVSDYRVIFKIGEFMRSIQIASVVAAILLGLLFLSGCGKSDEHDDGRTVITFWHSFVSSTQPALTELIREFEEQHPHIRIRAQYVPGGDAIIQRLITAIQSRRAPDIAWVHADYMQHLVQANAIYKMEHFIDGPNGLTEEDMADIYPPLILGASWRDTLYSMPMEATNLALVYNKRLFREAGLDPERPPQTWEELHEYAIKLTVDKSGNGVYDQIGFFVPILPSAGPLSSWMVWQWMPFLWQAGGYMINEEQTRVMFNEEPGVRALALWKKLYEDMNLRQFSIDAEAIFASQQAAMVLDGPWSLPRFRDLRNLEWQIAPLPAGPVKQATVVGGEYLTIFKQSKNPDTAWEFIRWIVQPEVQAKWSMMSGYLPIRRSVIEVEEYRAFLEDHPGKKAFVEQMEFGQSPRSIDYYGYEISRQVAEALERATLGREDPQQALNRAAEQSNKMLDSVRR
jgi:multiple sugar transport system substrate-binding protein